jgi:plasmid stabilization system protein ParE
MLVRWTKLAANDLTHICDYTEENFGAAQTRRAVVAIYEAADSLVKSGKIRARPIRAILNS